MESFLSSCQWTLATPLPVSATLSASQVGYLRLGKKQGCLLHVGSPNSREQTSNSKLRKTIFWCKLHPDNRFIQHRKRPAFCTWASKLSERQSSPPCKLSRQLTSHPGKSVICLDPELSNPGLCAIHSHYFLLTHLEKM